MLGLDFSRNKGLFDIIKYARDSISNAITYIWESIKKSHRAYLSKNNNNRFEKPSGIYPHN